MHPTRYGKLLLCLALFFFIPVIVSSAILDVATPWLVFLYPTIVFVMIGVLLMVRREAMVANMLGKSRTDGTLAIIPTLIFLPYFLLTWTIWIIRVNTCRRKEHGFDKVSRGIYLGRYPFYATAEFPREATIVVDVTAEMPFPQSLTKSRRCFFLPSIDHCAPAVDDMIELANLLAPVKNARDVSDLKSSSMDEDDNVLHAATTNTTKHHNITHLQRLSTRDDPDSEGTPLEGSIAIFCANGKGRSATFTALLLAMREDCSIREAFAMMKSARPQVNAGEHQIKAAEDALASWTSTGGREALIQRLRAHENAREKSRLSDDDEKEEGQITTT